MGFILTQTSPRDLIGFVFSVLKKRSIHRMTPILKKYAVFEGLLIAHNERVVKLIIGLF